MKSTLHIQDNTISLDKTKAIKKTTLIMCLYLLLSVLLGLFINIKAGVIFFCLFTLALLLMFLIYMVFMHSRAVIDKESKTITLNSKLGNWVLKKDKIIDFKTLVFEQHIQKGFKTYSVHVNIKKPDSQIWQDLKEKEMNTINNWLQK